MLARQQVSLSTSTISPTSSDQPTTIPTSPSSNPRSQHPVHCLMFFFSFSYTDIFMMWYLFKSSFLLYIIFVKCTVSFCSRFTNVFTCLYPLQVCCLAKFTEADHQAFRSAKISRLLTSSRFAKKLLINTDNQVNNRPREGKEFLDKGKWLTWARGRGGREGGEKKETAETRIVVGPCYYECHSRERSRH